MGDGSPIAEASRRAAVPATFQRGEALLQGGVLVRDCASFGLPEYIRVATRRPEENARLLTALEELRPWCDSC